MRLIKIKVAPDAKKDKITLKGRDSFDVSVRAPAERGEANAAVISLVSKSLGIPRAKLRIIKGSRSKAKIIEIWE